MSVAYATAMITCDDDPLDATADGLKSTGKASALTGGPNPGETGHEGAAGDESDLGLAHYSPEMGTVVVNETLTGLDDL